MGSLLGGRGWDPPVVRARPLAQDADDALAARARPQRPRAVGGAGLRVLEGVERLHDAADGEDHSGSTSWRRRFTAISQYFGSISMPIHLPPRSLAASSELPEPANGSSSVPGANGL